MDKPLPQSVTKPLVHDPFGMITFGRSWEAGSGYRYGFNGMEGDDEILGNDNALDFGARVYDARLGRWFSPDRFEYLYPNLSTYSFVNNNPLLFLDKDGNNIYIKTTTIDGKEIYVQFKGDQLYNLDGSIYNGNDDYLKTVQQQLIQLKKDHAILKQRLEFLETTTESNHLIEAPHFDDPKDPLYNPKCQNRNYPSTGEEFNRQKNNEPASTITQYDPHEETDVFGNKRNPRVGLAHELLGHGYDSAIGEVNHGDKTDNKISIDEIEAVNIENLVRVKTGDTIRTTYSGKEIPSDLLWDPVLKEVENSNVETN